MSDPELLDCPPCKADGFELCVHTEDQRVKLRLARAERNRAKKKRQQANYRRDRKAAFLSGDKWV